MNDNEQLKLTDFSDPLVMMAILLAFFGDVLFIVIPVRYIFAVIVGAVIWPKTKGFVTKLIFAIALVLPLPLLALGVVLAILLSNSFIRFVAVQVGIAVLTGGVGTLAEAGALAVETAGKLAAQKVVQEAAEKVGGEKAGAIAGMATGAVAGKTTGGAEGAAAKAGTAEAKASVSGPAAQPPTMKGPQAQPEQAKTAGQRAKEKLVKRLEKERDELSEEIAGDRGGEGVEKSEPDLASEGLENPDVAPIAPVDNLSEQENEVVDLRRAA